MKSQEFRLITCPPAILLLAAAGLGIWHGWLPVPQSASAGLASQTAYTHLLYTRQAAALPAHDWHEELPGAALRGLLGSSLALLLALTSVFRARLTRWLRIGAFFERGAPLFRAMQRGHAGDYVSWLTVGLAAFGTAAIALLRP